MGLQQKLALLAPIFSILVIFLYCLGAIIKDDIVKRNVKGKIVRSEWITTDIIAPVQLLVAIVLSVACMFALTRGESVGYRAGEIIIGGVVMGLCASFASNGSYDVYHGLRKWLEKIYSTLKKIKDSASAGTSATEKEDTE
jgi:predicted membrane chloride channel (bestrophin family)